MPLISVILPVYNIKGEYLTKAVRSVLAQSFEDFELLIVDDGCVGKRRRFAMNWRPRTKGLWFFIMLTKGRENRAILV